MTGDIMAIGNFLLKDLSVLVIDDHDFTRHLIASILRKIGIGTVREAATGATAFSLLGLAPVSVILCDLEMEPMGGLDFIRRLRSGDLPLDVTLTSPLDTATPVLVLTAHTSTEIVKKACEVGASGFICKPINPKLIRHRIETLAGNSHRSQKTNLYNLIYSSVLTPGVTKDDLKKILIVGQLKNAALNVSGVVCFNANFFLQILEGEKDAVEAIYAKIVKDTRHRNLKVITQGTLKQRNFAGWSMLFIGDDTFAPSSMAPSQALKFMIDLTQRHSQV